MLSRCDNFCPKSEVRDMVLKPFIFFLHFLLLLERLVSGRRSKIVDKKTDVGPTTLSTEKLERRGQGEEIGASSWKHSPLCLLWSLPTSFSYHNPFFLNSNILKICSKNELILLCCTQQNARPSMRGVGEWD
jgi:hypothetical protein